MAERIPVMRPHLPSADSLLPYLRRIDAARIYTNFGPLVSELESRLSAHLELPEKGLATASSGTAALAGAILAAAGRATPPRPLALIPAYTFTATAAAAEMAGYRPFFVDIDSDSWLLNPNSLEGHAAIELAGVVVPVAAYGRPVAQSQWLEFQRVTGVPVVIDGAACFETVACSPERYLGEIPVTMSFHATKSFSTGEGGCVCSTDPDFATRVAQCLNFGFHMNRDTAVASWNGKLSEYHAAVGLAALDEWPAKQAAFVGVAEAYRKQFAASGLASGVVAAPEVAGSYVLFMCNNAVEADCVRERMSHHGIGFRMWYGSGLHRQSYYRHSSSDVFPTTDHVASLLIGLPTASDMQTATVGLVAEVVAEGMASCA